jgi:hypothetical protein
MVTSARFATRARRTALVAGLGLSLIVSACSSNGGASPTVPLPTNPPTTPPPATSSTSSTSTSTTSTTLLNPPPSITSPPTSAPPTIVLPSVDTLVPEVSPQLLSPQQADPASANNSRPVLPDQLPVLEAYLSSIQATTKVSSTWPIDPQSPLLLGAAITPEGIQQFQEASAGRLARGEVLNVSQGVTFRPYVVGPVTDTATVMDCELAGHYWVKAATGEPLPPNEIWPAGPGHIVEVGLRETFVLRDGRWLSASSQIDPAACA